MPSYELALIFRTLGRSDTAAVLKRTAENIFKNKGVLYGIENLGKRTTPYAISSFNRRYREGNYFLMRLELPAPAIEPLKDEFKRDIDILKSGFIKEKPVEHVECTLEEEMKPPAYREDVRKMIEEGRKKEFKYNLNIGVDRSPSTR